MAMNYKREDVAVWAQYCMGSCHGDWSPEAEAIYSEVMRNNETFEFYRKTFEGHRERKLMEGDAMRQRVTEDDVYELQAEISKCLEADDVRPEVRTVLTSAFNMLTALTPFNAVTVEEFGRLLDGLEGPTTI